MKRLVQWSVVLVLGLVGALAHPVVGSAAPLPAGYTAAAGGDIVAVDLQVVGGVGLANARVAVSQATVDSGATPRSSASASNLAAAVAGLGIAMESEEQTAPPDNPTADEATIASATAPGLLSLGALSTSVQARWAGDDSCVTGDGLLADAQVESAGTSVDPVGLVNVATTGVSSTRGLTSLVPAPAGDPLNRAVRSQASGATDGASFLDGLVQVDVTDVSTLTATATGEPGGSTVVYDPGTITVTVAGDETVVEAGTSDTFAVPGGEVVITANNPTVTEAANGRQATGTVSVFTAQIRVGPANAPLATSTIDVLPLRASATAPVGGIDCPPPTPVLITPADGSETTDTTPEFSGTGTPGATIDLTVDGDVIDDATVVDEDGNWTFTPTTPLAIGPHTASVTQTTEGGTSAASNENQFTVLPPRPVLVTPGDGTTTADTTPTFTGTTVPGATIELTVDGDLIGTAIADDAGDFTFTPTTPLAAGDHRAIATATVNGLESAPSEPNDFAIDITAPAAPVLQEPADESVTDDTTPAFTGTAEADAEVEIFVDGTSIGTTTADGDGNFTFTPTTPLAPGDHSAYAVATDPAGNVSAPSNTNDFVIDATDPAAPQIVSPADGSTTTDPTPNITGTGEPGATVTVSVDGDAIGTAVVDGDGNWSLPVTTPLDDGEHTATAVQTDQAGNTSSANTVTFTVDTTADDVTSPQPPVITSPTDGDTTTDTTPPITGTAEPGSTVVVIIDGREAGRVTTDQDGNFTFTPTSPLTAGDHEITAIAVDAAGNTSNAATPVSITVLDTNDGGQDGNGQNGNGQRLGDTGGPAWWPAVAGALLVAAGIATISAHRTSNNRTRRRSMLGS